MKYTVVASPASPVVSLAEVKEHVGIIDDYHNGKLTALSKSAEDYFEKATGRFLLARTIEAYFDSFDSVVVKHRPKVTVESVEYCNEANAFVEMLTDDYAVDSFGLDTVVTFGNYPTLGDSPNPIIVRYQVGYGNAAAVPDLAKYAIASLAAHWYMNREPAVIGTIVAELPFHVESIINQFRVVEV